MTSESSARSGCTVSARAALILATVDLEHRRVSVCLAVSQPPVGRGGLAGFTSRRAAVMDADRVLTIAPIQATPGRRRKRHGLRPPKSIGARPAAVGPIAVHSVVAVAVSACCGTCRAAFVVIELRDDFIDALCGATCRLSYARCGARSDMVARWGTALDFSGGGRALRRPARCGCRTRRRMLLTPKLRDRTKSASLQRSDYAPPRR
jgi:hypothetical protein